LRYFLSSLYRTNKSVISGPMPSVVSCKHQTHRCSHSVRCEP
jgi:hypothetical protein